MSGRYKLRFDLQSRNNTRNWYYAEYSTFRVLPETDNYELKVSGYSGNAGYNALSYHNDMMFSTYDRDNDPGSGHCAARWGSGFWYNNCHYCGVNAAHSTATFFWHGLPGGRPLQSARMWLQCK